MSQSIIITLTGILEGIKDKLLQTIDFVFPKLYVLV